MDSSCIFCRIARGEAPAALVHQDELSVAFRDSNPQAPTHVLVVPRKHIVSLAEAETEGSLLGHLLKVAVEVARSEGVGQGFRTIINTGAPAGQSVFHLHVHVMGGRPLGWPPG